MQVVGGTVGHNAVYNNDGVWQAALVTATHNPRTVVDLIVFPAGSSTPVPYSNVPNGTGPGQWQDHL